MKENNIDNTTLNRTSTNNVTSYMKIPITDRFMFPLVMSHKEIAKPFLKAIPGIKTYDFKDPEQEKTEQISPFYKGIRCDVFTQKINEHGETIRSFDLEYRAKNEKAIAEQKRKITELEAKLATKF